MSSPVKNQPDDLNFLAILREFDAGAHVAKQEGLSDRAAFERLYDEQGSRVRNFLRVSVGNLSVADDLTQETFLHFWRRRDDFDPGRGGVSAYLLGIARKKGADWWRRTKTDTAVSAESVPSRADGLVIRDAINRLPEGMRTVLWLREAEGHSYDELAEILDIPVGTVRSRLYCARQQLRAIWMKGTQ